MERRREPRFPADQPAMLMALGPQQHCLPARIVEVSGRGMRLLLPQPLKLDTPVRVDCADTMLLGEVCYCLREGDQFMVGLELEHSLANLSEIGRLVDSLLGEERIPSESVKSPGF